MSTKTKAIYDLTHQQLLQTTGGRLMRDYLWAEFGGYVGQLSWATRDQLEALAHAAGISSSTRVLDLCCGTGGIALHMAQTFGCQIVGIDYSDTAIPLARQLAEVAGLAHQVQFLHGNALALPFPDASFDVVFCVDSLVIVPRRWQVIAECARVLKPGGRIAFSDEVFTGSVPRDAAILRAINVYGRLYPETPRTYRRLLEEAGFTAIETEDTTATFVAISDRWAAAYRRYEPELRAALGDVLFDDGLLFFETLRDLGRQGVLGQVRLSATCTGVQRHS